MEDHTCSPVIEDILSKVNTDANSSAKAFSDETIVKDEIDNGILPNNKLNSTQIYDDSTVILCDGFNNISEIVHSVIVENDIEAVTSKSLITSDKYCVSVDDGEKMVEVSAGSYVQKDSFCDNIVKNFDTIVPTSSLHRV